jgi:cell fate (sporulation/competence/biofilm development) regulator YlbF (YheA/YmcA/DUF963 family)
MDNTNPYDKAHELARAIVNHEVYLRYVEAKNDIEKQPDIKDRIINLRSKQMEINQAQMLGNNIPEEKVRGTALEYAQMSRNKTIARFFEAEAQFAQMFADIQEILQKAIEEGLQ